MQLKEAILELIGIIEQTKANGSVPEGLRKNLQILFEYAV
jgi:hypothetical protein